MPTFYVRDRDRQAIRDHRAVKGEAVSVSVDFSAWAEDNGAITSATWTVKNGNATVSGQALASNVASAVVTTANAGWSLIEVKGAGATHTKIFNIRILARDPYVPVSPYDYWWSR